MLAGTDVLYLADDGLHSVGTDLARLALHDTLRHLGFDVDRYLVDHAHQDPALTDAVLKEACRQLEARVEAVDHPRHLVRTSKYAKARAKYAKQRRDKRKKRGRR